jgi:hypothetical protein
VCTPNCGGKACGPDGCGGLCGTCVASPDPCGGITYEGCCEGTTAKWCENDQVQFVDCADEPLCGWDASAGYYYCGTDGQADPSGSFPMACP